MTRQPSNSAEPSQLDKFRDLARELECDEDEKQFEDTVKRISEKPKGERPTDEPS